MNSTDDKTAGKRIRVALATWGRFHFFDLARELDELGVLERLFTSYPRPVVERFGVRPEVVQGSWFLEPLSRCHRAISPARDSYVFRMLRSRWENSVISRLMPVDVFVGMSGFCVDSLRRAQAEGGIAVLERASSHIQTQRRILIEEQALTGYPIDQVSEFDIEREEEGYEAADYVLVPSTFCFNSFVEQGYARHKLLQCSLGVNLSGFSPATDWHPRKQSEPLRVVNAGAFSARKGMHYLVETATALRGDHFQFTQVGATADLGHLVANLPRNFRHLPSVRQQDLVNIYRGAHVFVLPTLEDGFPTVIPQAMACGLPVITTRNGSGEDLIRDGENGFLVPIRDSQAICERLELLYREPDRCFEMGRNARMTVEEGYSWADYGKRMLGIYEHVVNFSECSHEATLQPSPVSGVMQTKVAEAGL